MEMALLRVVSDIQSAAGNGQCTAVLALDISSAFDAVDHGTLTDRARTRHGTGSHFVTQRPSDPGIQRPGDPVDPVVYNELQMSTYV